MIACGYDVGEITDFVAKLRVEELLNADVFGLFATSASIDDGKAMRATVARLLVDKGFDAGIHFGEFKKRSGISLEVYVTNTSIASSQRICADTMPDLPVIDGVIASMSVPLIFPPVVGPQGERWVDGCFYDNFPIAHYDASTVLGFTFKWLIAKAEEQQSVFSVFRRLMQIVEVPQIVANWAALSPAHKARTVVIETSDAPTINFTSPSPSLRQMLVEAGHRAIKTQYTSTGIANQPQSLDPGAELAENRVLPFYLTARSPKCPETV